MVRGLCGVVAACALAVVAVPSAVRAQPDPDPAPPDSVPMPEPLTEEPVGDDEPATAESPAADTGRRSVLPLPPGCSAPELPHVVFLGTIVARDFRTARFRIDSVRDGDPAPFAGSGLVDVRYGLDIDALDEGEQYLVGAEVEPSLGLLVSKVREPAPMFGGDDIVGLAESDTDCPVVEDPIRTLLPDGSAPESGLLSPFVEDRGPLLRAFVVPVAVAFGIAFALALLKFGVSGLWRGLTSALRYRPPSLR